MCLRHSVLSRDRQHSWGVRLPNLNQALGSRATFLLSTPSSDREGLRGLLEGIQRLRDPSAGLCVTGKSGGSGRRARGRAGSRCGNCAIKWPRRSGRLVSLDGDAVDMAADMAEEKIRQAAAPHRHRPGDPDATTNRIRASGVSWPAPPSLPAPVYGDSSLAAWLRPLPGETLWPRTWADPPEIWSRSEPARPSFPQL